MSATDLMVWGLVVHLICDWALQNEWMALNKMKRLVLVLENPREERSWWWLRHPAAYVHAGIHTLGMLLVFDPMVALAIGVSHFLIDLRTPVAWWSQLIRQSQPAGDGYDVGLEVRFWTDQVFHITAIAIAALVAA